jgi:O-antigen/teichoic acid export membrane protein
MQAESVTRNTSYLTFSYIIQKALAFFYFIFVARALGVEDLGKYTFALSFTTIFAVFVDLGLTSALIRESAKEEKDSDKILSATIGIKLIVSFLVYGLIILIVNLMDYPDITKQLVYLSGIIMLLDQFTLSFFGIFRGRRNLKLESLSVIINQTIILISGLIIIFLKLPLIYFFLPFVFGSAFNLVFSAINVRRLGVKFRISFDWKDWKFILKLAMPFALIAIFSRIYGNIDTVLLSKMAGDQAVGLYGVAMKIPFALQFIPSALAAAIFPAFSYQFSHDRTQLKDTFDKVMKFLVTAVVPVAAGIAILADPIIRTFYGDAFAPAILPLQILMLGLMFVFLNFPLGSLLNSCNKQTTNTILVGVTMVINILLNIWLIPKYGFVGASWVFVSCHGFLFLASLIVAAKIIPYGKKSLLVAIAKNLLSASVMEIVIIWFMPRVNFLMLIPIGAIVYITCIFALEAVTIDEIKYFSNSLIRKKAADNLPVDGAKQ